MTLLFDHNLSRRLPAAIAGLFPDARYVSDFSLAQAEDDLRMFLHQAGAAVLILE